MPGVDLSHIVAAVEFAVAEMAQNPGNTAILFSDESEVDRASSPTEAAGQETA